MTDDRRSEYELVIALITRWAKGRADVVAVAVVGSWARGEADMDSDVDLIVLTHDQDRYVHTDHWVTDALGSPAEIVRTRAWGPLLERRVRLASGLEIEFGFVEPSWAATDPVDAGTRQVVADGLLPLVDHVGLLEALAATIAS